MGNDANLSVGVPIEAIMGLTDRIGLCIFADINNWKIDIDKIDQKYKSDAGTGGFLPFGIAGVTAGAAKCFYGFVGFDAVATTGEEAKNPQRDIPLAIVISLSIIFAAYFAISAVLTMVWPYYLQDSDAPFPYVFDQLGWYTIKWIVTVGAIFALCTSLLGAMFPLPRVIYAMANDGIIFRNLSKVNSWTQTPIISTFSSGIFAGIMATIFDVDQLIDMMSIGTLLAYTIVAISVLILRYDQSADETYPGLDVKENKTENVEQYMWNNFRMVFNLNNNKYPTKETSKIVNWSIALFNYLKQYVLEVEAYHNLKVSKIRSDNGGEYIDSDLRNWYKYKETIMDTTIPHSLQLNGEAERLNRTIMKKAKRQERYHLWDNEEGKIIIHIVVIFEDKIDSNSLDEKDVLKINIEWVDDERKKLTDPEKTSKRE
nr:cationic amino acid transporter 3-like [Leptinotarsa decemlineata]